jgi:hypothetical protein
MILSQYVTKCEAYMYIHIYVTEVFYSALNFRVCILFKYSKLRWHNDTPPSPQQYKCCGTHAEVSNATLHRDENKHFTNTFLTTYMILLLLPLAYRRSLHTFLGLVSHKIHLQVITTSVGISVCGEIKSFMSRRVM